MKRLRSLVIYRFVPKLKTALVVLPLVVGVLMLVSLMAGQVGPAVASPHGQYPVQPTPATAQPTKTAAAGPSPVVPTQAPEPATPTPLPPPAAPAPTVAAQPTAAPTVAPTRPATAQPTTAAGPSAVVPTKAPAGATPTGTATDKPKVVVPAISAEPGVEDEGPVKGAIRTMLNTLGTLWMICGIVLFLAVAAGVVYLFRGRRGGA